MTFMLDFAVVSSSPLMANGRTVHKQFIDSQRPSFGCRFFFGREPWLHDDDTLSVTPVLISARGYYITDYDANVLEAVYAQGIRI